MSTPSTLGERLIALIKDKTGEARRYKELEEMTKIPADRWKAFALGRQRPTMEMIEAAACKWPSHAYWLATGFTLPDEGHDKPPETTMINSITALVLERRIELQKMALSAQKNDEEASATRERYEFLLHNDGLLQALEAGREENILRRLTEREKMRKTVSAMPAEDARKRHESARINAAYQLEERNQK